MSKKRLTLEDLGLDLQIGDVIEYDGSKQGIVRFIGNIHFKEGQWIGLEIPQPTGNHDGLVKGMRYFKTEPNQAAFVKPKKITKILEKHEPQTNSQDQNQTLNDKNVTIGVYDENSDSVKFDPKFKPSKKQSNVAHLQPQQKQQQKLKQQHAPKSYEDFENFDDDDLDYYTSSKPTMSTKKSSKYIKKTEVKPERVDALSAFQSKKSKQISKQNVRQNSQQSFDSLNEISSDFSENDRRDKALDSSDTDTSGNQYVAKTNKPIAKKKQTQKQSMFEKRKEKQKQTREKHYASKYKPDDTSDTYHDDTNNESDSETPQLEAIQHISLDSNKSFDNEAVEKIKQILQETLNKELKIITENLANMYPELVNSKKKSKKLQKSLQMFIDGLMEFENAKSQNAQYVNKSQLASQLEAPWNELTDGIIEIGGSIDYGFIAWELSLLFIKFLGSIHPFVWLPTYYIAMILPSSVGIRLLFELPDKLISFPPQYISKIGQYVIQGSDYPMAYILKVAHFFQILSISAKAHTNKYIDLYREYSELALKKLNQLCISDHTALIALECATDLEPFPEDENISLFNDNSLDTLQVAIRTGNRIFVSDARVLSILNAMWESSNYLSGETKLGTVVRKEISTFDKIDLSVLLRHHYRVLPALPYGKFIFQVVFFLVYVAILSWFCIRRISMTAAVWPAELLLWGFGLSFSFQAILEILFFFCQTQRMFTVGYSDVVDVIVGLNFTFLASVRLFSVINTQVLKENERTATASQLDDLQFSFDVFFTITTILLYLRVASSFQMSSRFGPLLRIVEKMFTDVKNFAVLYILFLFGFSFSLYYFVGNNIESFTRLVDAVLNTFSIASTGEVDWGEFSSQNNDAQLSPIKSSISQILILILILMGSLLLINMFIAMMAKTFDQVYERSNQEWSMGAAKNILQFDRKQDWLPPPMNVVIYTIVGLWLAIELPLFLFAGILPFGIGNNEVMKPNWDVSKLDFKTKIKEFFTCPQNMWICSYCHEFQLKLSTKKHSNKLMYWMQSIGLDKRDQITILKTKTQLCQFCKRVRRPVKRYEYVGDVISYCIAWVIILPIIAIITLPLGAIGGLVNNLSDVEKNTKEEFYQLLKQKRKESKQKEINDDDI